MKSDKTLDDLFEKFLNEGFKCDNTNCRCYCHSYQFGDFCFKLMAGIHMLFKLYLEMLTTLREAVKSEPKRRKTDTENIVQKKSKSDGIV